MNDKLEAFRALLEADQHRHYGDAPCHASAWPCSIKIGRKYANVDVGRSGKYMVDLSTGNIYGIKAYGVIHRGHQFGTLDTINEWEWSGYRAMRKAQS